MTPEPARLVARRDLRAFRRNTRARIFTLAVPVVLLLILVSEQCPGC
jgi:hypothetical protein